MIGTHSILMALPELLCNSYRGETKAFELRRAKPKPKHSPVADRLAVVELVGTIDAENAGRAISSLASAVRNPQIGGVAMLVDSGGGYADALWLCCRRRCARRLTSSQCTSTWAARLRAWTTPPAARNVDYGERMVRRRQHRHLLGACGHQRCSRRVGIRFVLVKAGQYKAKGHPGIEVSDEMIADTERVVNGVNRLFLSAVSSGRDLPMLTLLRDLATGQTWLGRESSRSGGLVDDVKSLTTWMADLTQQHPPEQYMNLHDEAAVAKACDLLNVQSLRDASATALVALRKQPNAREES